MKTFATFKDLNLPAPLAEALEKMNFVSPTPVQAESLPPALAGKDVLGSAQTGTGKTGAFGIPLLAKLYPNPGSKALILAPTRELAAQIYRVLGQMSEGMHLKGALLVGGESFFQQKKAVKSGADYYVCTPGRLLDHLDAGLKIPKVCVLVLDEVDRMLDMGFAPQLKQIVPHIPKERQTLLFSATLPKEILAVANTYLKDPVRVNIGTVSEPVDRVTEQNIDTQAINKNELLLTHLKELKGRVIIFARTQRRVDRVYSVIERNKYGVVSLHGGRTQGQRKEALAAFRTGSHPVMVATDLAGRGIDVDDIECVINYDLPANREDYIHRIGRTARNGKTGLAYNYLTPLDNGGRDILTKPQKSSSALNRNKANSEKGGWGSRKGGKNRPAYQPRSADEGYNGEKRTSGIRKHFRKLPEGETIEGMEFEAETPATDERPRRAPSGEKRPYSPRSKPFGEKRGFGPRKSFGDRKPFGERKSFGDRERKPFGERRSFGDRDRKPFGERRSFGDRDRKPFGDRKAFGDRPSFGGDRERRPYGERKSFGDRKPFGDRRPSGDRKPFGERRSFGERKPFGEGTFRKDRFGGGGSGPKPFRERRPFGDDRRREDFDPESRFTRAPRTRVFAGRKPGGLSRRPKQVIDIPKKAPFRSKRQSKYENEGAKSEG